ncbi:unnamed protein product [Adineta ricciae]|uniref:Uncharacterized protein n=1 Tax=Adineta ricciae TaxID=249248 RepID=A0A815QPS6_ADIRI|nr:unnamed protein product [Adineta ricciae]
MDIHSESNQLVTETSKQSKWWHHRRAKIIGISFTVLIILSISLILILEFSIRSTKKPYITTTTTAQTFGKIITSKSEVNLADLMKYCLVSGSDCWQYSVYQLRTNQLISRCQNFEDLWHVTGSMNTRRTRHTAILLKNGK